MTLAWNDWYHCNGNTYGTWLRGDPRGYRERWHRRQVTGDYKHPPPPGAYEHVYQHSKSLMKHAAIHLNREQSLLAARAMVSKLLRDGILVIAASVDDHHFHILAKFPDRAPRRWIGKAKMHSSMLLRSKGLCGRVWAAKCRVGPIKDRDHQIRVF